MSYNELIALIDACVNRNGVHAITGRIMNGVLKAMVNQLGAGFVLGGVAHPADDPGTPEAPVCYFASEEGTYTHFGGLTIAAGEFALFCYDLTDGWYKETIYEGITEITASIDDQVGTPEVYVEYQNGVLSFDFRNMKGNTGDPAGFGNISADVDANIGTPAVTVSSSGPDTAKVLAFHFKNLKGETGVTSVVATVDNTSGNPTCAVSLNGQELHLDFTGLKGAQGDTGVSADYPIAIVNNLTTNDPTSALSAAMGVQLESEVSQLEHKVDDLSTGKYYGYFAKEEDLPEADVDGFAYVGEGPTYTIYNLRGGVWTSSDITVNQSPIGNDEDIDQNEDGKLQFANRVYNAQQPNGMGYKILRKDATFASQVTDENTIYEIRYPFALSANFTMPSGSILHFDGGSISGAYTLTGNNTLLSFSSKDAVIDGVILKGTWANTEFDVRNFGIVASSSFDCADITKMLLETQKDIFFPAGNYYFSELYLENTANGNFSIRGEENDAIRPLTNFFPLSNTQRYIIKGGGGKDNLGGSGRCYGLKIMSVNFRSLEDYSPDSLTVSYANTNTDYPFGLLILDKVERGHFRIFGNTAYNSPIVGIGYSYELTFDLFTVYGFRGKSDCPLINIVNNQSNSYSAIVIKQMMIESVTGPIIGTATKAAGSEIYIGSINFEGTIVGESTSFNTEPDWEDYKEVPLFDLKNMCDLNVESISLTTFNITYTNSYGVQPEDCIRTFLKVTDYYAAIAHFGYVHSGGTSSFLHFSGNAIANYKSSVVGDFSAFHISGSIANLYLSVSRRIDGISVLPTGEVFFNEKLAKLCSFSMSDSFLVNPENEKYLVACFVRHSGGAVLNHNGFYIESKYLKLIVQGSISIPTNLRLDYLDVNATVLSSDTISVGKDGLNTVWFEINKPQGYDHIRIANDTVGYSRHIYEISAVDDIGGLFGDTRPNNVIDGTPFYDKELGETVIWNGYAWVNTDGKFAKEGTGQLVIRVAAGTNRLVQMYAKAGNVCKLTIMSDGVTIASALGNAVKVDDKTILIKEYASGYNGFTIGGTDEAIFNVEIQNFQGMEYISAIWNVFLNSFSHCDALKSIAYVGTPKGNLVAFAMESPNLESFTLNPVSAANKTFDGNIVAFGNNTHIKTISLAGIIFKDADSIENFVAMQRAAGRTDTSNDKLQIKCYGCYSLSFNGARLVTANSLVDFYWTATTITIDSTTITA